MRTAKHNIIHINIVERPEDMIIGVVTHTQINQPLPPLPTLHPILQKPNPIPTIPPRIPPIPLRASPRSLPSSSTFLPTSVTPPSPSSTSSSRGLTFPPHRRNTRTPPSPPSSAINLPSRSRRRRHGILFRPHKGGEVGRVGVRYGGEGAGGGLGGVEAGAEGAGGGAVGGGGGVL